MRAQLEELRDRRTKLLNARAWLSDGPLQVYVRFTHRHLPDLGRVPTFDIANVSVDETERGNGVFTEFLELCESLGEILYIECVQEPRFQEFFARRGYKLKDFGGLGSMVGAQDLFRDFRVQPT